MDELEQRHVAQVYEAIADHFSATRYKGWPLVEAFLQSRPPGAVGLDIGCGNGKYLKPAGPRHWATFIIGSDASAGLIKHAAKRTGTCTFGDCLQGDARHLPHPRGKFDFCLSIAVLHHLASKEGRVAGVKAVLDALVAGRGVGLLYVWALEQQGSRRGWTADSPQDVFVPWKRGDETYQRYYHLYKHGELEEDVLAAGGSVVDSGWERDNWWCSITSPVCRTPS